MDGYYYLNVTAPSATSFVWSGDTNADGTGDWDINGSLNWNSNTVADAPPALVSFPNITGGGNVNITADVAPLSFEITNAAGNPYTFAGIGKITGATGIAKAGTGIAKFNGAAHDYSGTLATSAGAVIKQMADATTGGITVAADDVSFVLDGGITDGVGQTLTISGRGALTAGYFFIGSAVQRGALQAHNGASTWEGDIVLASNSTSVLNRIGVQNGASLTLTGNISESVTEASLVFRAGTLGGNITLGGTGTYAYHGQTQIFSNGGSIILGADNKLPTGANVFFGSGGTTVFDMNGNDQEFAGLNGNAMGAAATIANHGTSPSTLTITSPAETPTETADYYPGLIANGTTGNTTVEDGTLSVAQPNFADTSTVRIGLAEASVAVINLPNAGTDIVAALVIDGVSQPGGGALYDKDNSGGAITGDGKIQVGMAGYSAWATANNVVEGENGDDYKDGISNLVEYALGLNPQASSQPQTS